MRYVLAVIAMLLALAVPAPAQASTGDFWVEFKAQANLKSAPAIKDWSARGAAVVDELRSTAASSQAGVVGLLKDAGASYTSLYINNSIYVRGGSAVLMEKIGKDPAVARVRAPRVYELPQPSLGAAGTPEWGVSAIQADKVWDAYKTTGTGIVVGNIDSGVDFQHPALVSTYRGNNGDGTFTHDYNWYDPTQICAGTQPCDNFGHGTHTMGTMVGQGGIGVAPGSRWIAAKGCPNFQCTDVTLALAAQWMLAPTAADGSAPDPAKRPNILNNSWSSAPGDEWYRDYVRQWVAAGIFPAFAVGNDGPSCGTQHSPGEYPESYAIGAVDQNGLIASFSSRGTDGMPDSKPDIVAPGQGIRSSVPGGGYQVQNGTSMATPHVSGAVALLWSAAPALVGDIAATRAVLSATARDHDDTSCGGTPEDNNVYGEGMLDVYRAVGASPRAGTGTLTGTINDKSSGKPLAGVRVTATGPRTLDTVTGSDGAFRLYLDPGDYSVSTALFGFDASVVDGVRLATGASVTRDLALTATPTAKVQVKVTDASGHGWPLPATIAIGGKTWSTEPGDGSATLDLPKGGPYEVRVTPRYPGYQAVTGQITVSGDATQKFKAVLDPAACAAAPGYDAACKALAGGLVYGNVTDANTRKPVVTASVSADGGAPNASQAPDGFYWVFVPASGKPVVAAEQRGYQPASARVRSGADQVSRIDFALKAGLLSVASDDDISRSVRLGGKQQERITLTNRGTAPLTYSLAESRQQAPALGAGAPVRRVAVPGLSPGVNPPAGNAAVADGPSSDAWGAVADYPTTIRDNAAAYHDGKVYSFGGSLLGEGGTPASYAYDPVEGGWTRLADMPQARQKPASGFVDGKFYVVAGWGPQGEPGATTLVYDPAADRWTKGADNPRPWGAVGSAVLEGKIYSVGGCTGECQTATDQVTVYDVAGDRFREAAPYPEPISWAACAGIDGKVVCAGGLAAGPEGTRRAYAYDPAANRWSKVAELPTDLWASSYSAANGQLVVAGGVTQGGSVLTNEAFAYNPDADTWSAIANSRYALFRGAGACGFYKIGGANGPRVTPFSELLPGYDGCDPAGTDAPWLSESPTRGTLSPGATARVTLTLDARRLTQPGIRSARLTINENTPYPAPHLDVTLKATPPKHWAILSGQILSRSCDGTTAPLPGATLTTRGQTLGTTVDGRYSGWFKPGLHTFTVTAEGHRPADFTARTLPATETRHNLTLTRTPCTG
ncbi:S8 family serine peptidase [Nonomuraea sp. WAC 01424]|uniref:S8 family serine peptidase n=1 Tax=Nonomuraea sp. WAC 01424 TaxID=2203200 RepID=UPI000F78AC83|nr:S8 family serine peptidase [Nonomuraea sp. WAC 01424]